VAATILIALFVWLKQNRKLFDGGCAPARDLILWK
jgi:hypothetical protein